jgi:hypothetical protein
MRNIYNIYKYFSHRQKKNTENNTLRFGSKLLPSSGETTNPIALAFASVNNEKNAVPKL